MIKFLTYKYTPDLLGRFIPIEELYDLLNRGKIIKIYGYYQVFINLKTGDRYIPRSSPETETLEDKNSINSFIYGSEKRQKPKYNRVICFLKKSSIQELEKRGIMISYNQINSMKGKGLIEEETSRYYTEIYD